MEITALSPKPCNTAFVTWDDLFGWFPSFALYLSNSITGKVEETGLKKWTHMGK
jgi:hypothetical protein